MRFPVQCCCEPGKRLGWFDNPRLEHAGDVVRLPVAPEGYSPLRRLLEGDESPVHFGQVEVRVEVLWHRGRDILAINSHERELELWRRLPGFIEDQGFLE